MTDYSNESILRTSGNGNTVHCPAHPEECSYVRIVSPLGIEVAYWTADEWRDAPAEVMGAILGAALSGRPDGHSECIPQCAVHVPECDGNCDHGGHRNACLGPAREYAVTWEIDIEADTPEGAARQALETMRDPESIATVFGVRCPDGHQQDIDLNPEQETDGD